MVATRAHSYTGNGTNETNFPRDTETMKEKEDPDKHHDDPSPNQHSATESPPETKKQKVDKKTNDMIGGLKMEYAKSGRATCRKCRKAIDKGAPRVGMDAWISGRQATTWQCVICNLSNVHVLYEKTGRSKCSITGDSIEKGAVKIAIHSHTASRYFTLNTILDVLKTVLAWVPSGKIDEAKDCLNSIEGKEDLKQEDRKKLETILSKLDWPPKSKRGFIADEEDQAKDEEMKTRSSTSSPSPAAIDKDGKPKQGKVSHKEGEVEWEFAGGTYKGTLLPNKETPDQCFARTHNGNVKTLNKDKSYWEVVAP